MRFSFERSCLFCRMLLVLVLTSLPCLPAEAQCGPVQIAKLLPDDGEAGDQFGSCVATNGTITIVGADADDDNGFNSGSAYVFDATTGEQIAKLLPDDGAAEQRFGNSVAISGTTAIVGALWDDDNGDDSGSAYLFDTSTGEQIAKLLPDDGAPHDFFGNSVGIFGTTAIVGARLNDDNGNGSGSAYLFDTSTGLQIHKLLSNDLAAGDDFGYSVGISGTTAIVGANGDDDNGDLAGSAYLFDTTTGQQIAKLLPNDGVAGDEFGISVGIFGSTAIVGALWDDDNGDGSGSAYLFDTTTGQQLFKLLPDDGAALDRFGVSVSISGTTAIVGALGDDDNGNSSGSAYLFDTTTGQQVAKIYSKDIAAGDLFGASVSISGTTVVCGADWDDDNGDNSGSAYLFDVKCGPDPVCAGSGTLVEGFGETGDFSATCGSDDSYWGAHGAVFAFTFNDPVTQFELCMKTTNLTPGTIEVDIEAKKEAATANLIVTARLFNWTTGQYETGSLPGTMLLTTTDSTMTFTLVGVPSDYVGPPDGNGEGEICVLFQTIQTNGPANVRTLIDEAIFSIE